MLPVLSSKARFLAVHHLCVVMGIVGGGCSLMLQCSAALQGMLPQQLALQFLFRQHSPCVIYSIDKQGIFLSDSGAAYGGMTC